MNEFEKIQLSYNDLMLQAVQLAAELYICGRYDEKRFINVLSRLGYTEEHNLKLVELMAKLNPMREKSIKRLVKETLKISKKHKLI